MTLRLVGAPLPECPLCERPVRRDVAEKTGGLCTECDDVIADTIRMLPVRLPPEPDDLTVYVERYRPPVPDKHGKHRDGA
jgi:hypothetical protein